jgi:hypothetical protein
MFHSKLHNYRAISRAEARSYNGSITTQSAVKLADVYSVIGYYLNHQAEIEEYLKKRQDKAQENRKFFESRYASEGLRLRLTARKM